MQRDKLGKSALSGVVFIFILVGALGFLKPIAHAAVLDFAGLGPFDDPIPQTYGDLANLDLSYRQLSEFGNTAVAGELLYWDRNYSNLIDVTWGNNSSTESVAQISLTPSIGYLAVLGSFDLGFWVDDTYRTEIRVYDEEYSSLLFQTGLLELGGAIAEHVEVNITFAETLHLQWQNPWAVAIDNVNYGVLPAPIPLPTAIWLLGPGLIALLRFRKTGYSGSRLGLVPNQDFSVQ